MLLPKTIEKLESDTVKCQEPKKVDRREIKDNLN
jgi:hypothetical protein